MNEETGDALVFKRISDGYGEQFSDGEYLDFGTLVSERDRIADHQLFQYTVFNVLVSLAAEYRMGDQRPDRAGSLFFQHPGTFCQGAAGVADVVDDNYISVRYITNDHHAGDLVGPFPVFIADDHFGVEIAGDLPDSVGSPHVGGGKGKVFQCQILQIGDENSVAVEVVNGDVEIPLDLGGMEVHGDDPVGPGCHQHIGDQLATDGHPGAVLSVLSRIPIIRDHGNHLIRRSPTGSVDHQEQLHQILNRGKRALYEENIVAPNTFQKDWTNLAIAEALDIDLTKLCAISMANLLRQLLRSGAGEYFGFVHVLGELCSEDRPCG